MAKITLPNRAVKKANEAFCSSCQHTVLTRGGRFAGHFDHKLGKGELCPNSSKPIP